MIPYSGHDVPLPATTLPDGSPDIDGTYFSLNGALSEIVGKTGDKVRTRHRRAGIFDYLQACILTVPRPPTSGLCDRLGDGSPIRRVGSQSSCSFFLAQTEHHIRRRVSEPSIPASHARDMVPRLSDELAQAILDTSDATGAPPAPRTQHSRESRVESELREVHRSRN